MGTSNGFYFGSDAAATAEYIASIEGRPVTKGGDAIAKAADSIAKAASGIEKIENLLDDLDRRLAHIEKSAPREVAAIEGAAR
jgi:hypothetical protein